MTRLSLIVAIIAAVTIVFSVPAAAQERTGVEVGPAPQLSTNLTTLIGALLTQSEAINRCFPGGTAPINPSLVTTNPIQAEEYGGLGSPIPAGTMQGFPTASGRFVALSTGDAHQASGVFGTFNSFALGGNRDSATLRFDCNACPTNRGKYAIQWTYCTEENPTFKTTQFQDPATITIAATGTGSGAAIDTLAVDTAAPLSNAVGGTSAAPLPPAPSPDDVVYNACLLPNNRPRTVTANITGGGARFTLDVRDAGDNNLDTTILVDNVTVVCRLAIDLKPGSNPNCTNMRTGNGLEPVAILNSDGFDPANVNQSTIEFDGASPLRCAFSDADGDGDIDLVCHFRKSDMDTWQNAPANCKEVTLTALLNDGTSVSGSDILCTPGGENCNTSTPTTAPF